MAKFNVGDHVAVVKGQWKDNEGEIIEVEPVADEYVEQRYQVKLPAKPFGVNLPEECLEPTNSGDIWQ